VHEAQEKVVNVNIIIVSWGSAIGKLIIVGDVLPNYLRLFLGVDLGDLAYSWSPAPSSSEWDVVRDKLAWAHFDSPALLPLLPIMFYVYSAHISISSSSTRSSSPRTASACSASSSPTASSFFSSTLLSVRVVLCACVCVCVCVCVLHVLHVCRACTDYCVCV
jgi:hypothetical protein